MEEFLQIPGVGKTIAKDFYNLLMLGTEVDLDALAKALRYKDDDEANSEEFGEEEDAVDWRLQQADKFRYVRKVSNLGLRSLSDLKGADPDALYAKLCAFQRCQVDRCMLYVIRCAVYYATETQHDPELLKWWNWK